MDYWNISFGHEHKYIYGISSFTAMLKYRSMPQTMAKRIGHEKRTVINSSLPCLVFENAIPYKIQKQNKNEIKNLQQIKCDVM